MEIDHLTFTVNKGLYNKNDPQWIEAFEYYNDHHEKKLRLGCSACYRKVLAFINQHYK